MTCCFRQATATGTSPARVEVEHGRLTLRPHAGVPGGTGGRVGWRPAIKMRLAATR